MDTLTLSTTIGICFYIVYQFFWYYPKRMRSFFGLEKKKPLDTEDSDQILHKSQKIAHRGVRAEGLPENSLAAFEFALKEGYADVIECDVWLTKDNEIIIHHDETLLRMTGKSEKIREINYADLPPLLMDIPNQSEKISSYLSASKKEKHHRITKIPTLKEVLDLLPNDRFINIEFKHLSSELVTKVNDLIYAMGKEKQVFWFSLDEKINKVLRLHDEKLPSINSIQSLLQVLFYYYIGILPFIDLPDRVFCITVEEVSFSFLYMIDFFLLFTELTFFLSRLRLKKSNMRKLPRISHSMSKKYCISCSKAVLRL
jgi:hypothetical protein